MDQDLEMRCKKAVKLIHEQVERLKVKYPPQADVYARRPEVHGSEVRVLTCKGDGARTSMLCESPEQAEEACRLLANALGYPNSGAG